MLNPVTDEAEDVVMKLFSHTLHGNAKKWYDSLSNAGITSMDQFEEVFLEEWGIKPEDIPVLQIFLVVPRCLLTKYPILCERLLPTGS